MKQFVRYLEINQDYLLTHEAVPFTLNKETTGDYIYSWNVSPRFFPEDMQASHIRIRYLMDNANKVGLDDLVMPDQQVGDKLIEECHEITYDDFKSYYETDIAKKQGTIWNVDKFYNAIFMSKDTHDRVKSDFGRDVSLVFPAADCAVVRFYDPKLQIIGITHSDAVHTTRGIIAKSIEYMVSQFGSSKDDIEIYVGAFAKDGWAYDKVPDFALDETGELSDKWRAYIEKKGEKYLISYGDMIYDQIMSTGVSSLNVFFDPDNTLFNDHYFSNSRSYNSKVDGIPTYREGRNMMGITFGKDDVVSKALDNGVILR